MNEMQANEAVDRDWCLRSLTIQAVGRKIDNLADTYLIEQLNDSVVSVTDAGVISKCQEMGCALMCLTRNSGGVLQRLQEDGQAACEK